MDYLIRKFKEDIVNVINEANLPIEVKRMCLQEIQYEVTKVAENVIEEQKKQSEDQKNGDSNN